MAFNLDTYLRKFSRILHGVRKVWIFTLLEPFLCFYKTRRRGQCFIAPFQAEVMLAKFFKLKSVQNVFV